MKRNHLKLVLLIAGLVAVMGWSGQQAVCHGAADLDQKVKSGEYIKKIDNFMVIMDASDTLTKKYKGGMRFKLEKDVVTLMNQTIPDLDIMGALRIFSDKGNIDPWKPTELVYGLTKYSEAGFKEGLDKVKTAEGNSPLDLAIIAASKDLEGANGKIAVIIFSDGDKIPQKPVIAAAEGMKKQYGDRVCIYTVLVGDSQAGKDLLDKVAQAGQCGFATTADEINSEAAMSDFVQKVFLVQQPDSDGDGVRDHLDKCPDTPKGVKVDEVGCPLDSDGDGVPDYLDKCPDTPKGVEVDEVGCPIDSDGDGVPDYLDKCPDTPQGVKVDEVGCPLDSDGDGVPDYLDKCPNTPKGAKVDERGCWTYAGAVLFDLDKADLRPEAIPVIDEIFDVLKMNPDLRVEIQGHTCDLGSDRYNQGLSERRAQTVFRYLVEKGVDEGRLSVRGFGESSPAYPNTDEDNRAKNRRVQLKPM